MKNRIIKFRVWDNDYSKMSEPFFLYETSTIISISFSESGGHSLEISKEKNIMQFTGLCDKNGKEIYEGDIIVDWNVFDQMKKDGYADHECYNVISFYDGIFCFGRFDIPIAECNNMCEVVGNIYQNPELLTNKQ